MSEKTPPYLVKNGKEIFAYAPLLAERVDMKPYFGTLEDFNKGVKKDSPTVVGAQSPEARILRIVDAFTGLSPEDFVAGGPRKGMAKLDAIRTILADTSITDEELKEAHARKILSEAGK